MSDKAKRHYKLFNDIERERHLKKERRKQLRKIEEEDDWEEEVEKYKATVMRSGHQE